MNNLFSNDDMNWFKDINIKENTKYNYDIKIVFLNIDKSTYFNILENFKYLDKKHIIVHEYLKVNNNYTYIKEEYKKYELYMINKTIRFKYLDYIPASISLNSNLILNNDLLINDRFKKIKKEKLLFIIKKMEFIFSISNDNEYNIEIKIGKLENIKNIEIICFNKLRNIINYIPIDNYIIHKLHLYKIKSLMKQPIPLKSENDIKTDFAVTQKFDGIRSIMFINEIGKVFIIKNNLTTLIKTNLICNSLYNIIIDGELIDGKIFYAIDIIFYENIKLKYYNLKDRINLLKKINFEYENNNIYIYYKVKHYYFENIFENSKKLIKKKYYYNINDIKYEVLTDGLIFNSISDIYKNCIIYKWKPIITFDFKISKIKKYGNNILWELYCYSYNKEYVLFPISKYNKLLVNYEIDILYENNKIIEFAFNKEKNYFYPIKTRNDKKYPNFIKIALDNWYCLSNNILF